MTLSQNALKATAAGATPRPTTRWSPTEGPQPQERLLALEVPIALAYNNVSHAVMMATPTEFEAFAVGFSLSEGIVAAPEQISDLRLRPQARGMVIHMTIPSAPFQQLARRQRSLAGATGCGLCGTKEIESALRTLPPCASDQAISAKAIHRAMADLHHHQPLNQQTGGLHAAAFIDAQGEIITAVEDVGRHNALDKLIGRLALAKIDATRGAVLMTSRCSFELVQKAATVGIPIMATISVPTQLAADLARQAQLTLVALVRRDSLLVVGDERGRIAL